jgi:hypothetical protein
LICVDGLEEELWGGLLGCRTRHLINPFLWLINNSG